MSRASWAHMQLHARKSAFLSLSTSVIALSLLPPTTLQAAEDTDTPGLQRAPAASQQDIIVTASPFHGDRDTFATIVERVDRNEILKQGGANLADALRDVPGVTGTGFAAGASRPVIRGFDANRVRILENGVGSADVSEVGPDHGVPIDPLSAQSIEVVRGAATLRYGSQAIGGVVNAINNRIPLTLPDKAIGGEVTGSYGLNGDSRQGSGLLDARLGQFALHADGFARNVNDYRTPEGPEPNSFFEGNGYSAGSSYFFGDGNQSRIGGAYIHYNAKYGIPNEVSFIDMHQDKALLGSSIAIDKGAFQKLTVDGGYANYTHSEIVPGEGVASTFNDEEWDGRGEAVFRAFGPFTAAAVGVQAQNRRFSALGEGADYLLPTLTHTYAGFVFTESQLAKSLLLQLAARVETVSIEGTPGSDLFTRRHFTPISGSAGLIYEASDAVKLGLTLASAARAPNQVELFARGPHDGPRTFETGNSALSIERANSIEGTVRVRLDNVKIEGALWGALFKNYIFGHLTGRTCDEDGVCADDESQELRELFYDQRNAIFWGAEAKAAVGLYQTKQGGGLAAQFLADYVRATFEGGGNVPRITPYHIGVGLNWTSQLVDADVRLTYTGRQDAVSFAETPTKSFFSLDSGVTIRPFKAKPELEFSIVGHNLTDSVERDAVALNKDEVLLPGRDVKFIVRLAF